jgi:hypothetical protein
MLPALLEGEGLPSPDRRIEPARCVTAGEVHTSKEFKRHGRRSYIPLGSSPPEPISTSAFSTQNRMSISRYIRRGGGEVLVGLLAVAGPPRGGAKR